MTKRHDNMLEAFRESARIEETKPVPQPRAGEALSFPGSSEGAAPAPATRAPRAEGDHAPAPESPEATREEAAAGAKVAPGARRRAGAADVVEVTGRSAPSAPPASPSAAPERGTRITLPLGREWFFGLVALALTVVFMLGRWSAGTVAAAGPAERSQLAADSPGTPESREFAGLRVPTGRDASPSSPTRSDQDGDAAGDQASGQIGLTAAGRAFLDPSNIFTVVAITYDDSEAGCERAISTYRHLEATGFDVVYPRRKSGKLLIFVGAAPGYRDLESVEGELRRTRGPSGRLPFTGAYRVNIADYR
ncbi:MAG: hypothetical protein ACI8QZ_001349 [Chlamydiales bacterium]|jgi:hypothetical protein